MTGIFKTLLLTLLVSTMALGQTEPQKTVPIYRITVVGRTVKAINYRHRSAPTKVDFRGTSLMPEAKGTAYVQSKQGAIEIDAELKRLEPASKFGPEYLTYFLWAISPQGRPLNLGEVLLNDDGNSKLNVSSDLQSFGLIVTAEPYFAVTQPSDVVVMKNFVTPETNGTIEEIDAKFELLRRGSTRPMSLRPNFGLSSQTGTLRLNCTRRKTPCESPSGLEPIDTPVILLRRPHATCRTLRTFGEVRRTGRT